MEACSFDEANLILNPPPDMSPDDCTVLSVLRTSRSINSNRFPIVISCWKLTDEELKEINKTGRIWLTVLGLTMPPVILTGKKNETINDFDISKENIYNTNQDNK